MAESLGQALSLGKTLRLARLFDPDSGTAVKRDVLEMVRGAMDAGAAGVAMGRKIWQSPDPVGLVRAVSAIIRQGAGVDDAMGLLTADA